MSGDYVHGAVFAGGVYSDVVGVEPFFAPVENEVVGDDSATDYAHYGWAPARLPVLVSLDARTQSVLAIASQYRLGVPRLCPEMTVYIYKSYAEDTRPRKHPGRGGGVDTGRSDDYGYSARRGQRNT